MRALTPQVVLRKAHADGWYPKTRIRVLSVLQAQARAVARRISAGARKATDDELLEKYGRRLQKTRRPLAIKMASEGRKLGLRELGRDDAAGKAEDSMDTVRIDFGVRLDPQPVEEWLKETSKLETDATRKRYERIMHKAEATEVEVVASDGHTYTRSPTVREIARQTLQEGLAWSRTRAELMSRTLTMWSYNEGAHQAYRESGIAVEEWLTTEDDLLCPFCKALDGRRVRTEDTFVRRGAPVWVKDGDGGKKYLNRSMPFDIQHPPLHPHCRCALLPVVAGA